MLAMKLDIYDVERHTVTVQCRGLLVRWWLGGVSDGRRGRCRHPGSRAVRGCEACARAPPRAASVLLWSFCNEVGCNNESAAAAFRAAAYGADGTHPVTPESVYDVASITKVAATAMALMAMQSEGTFDPDEPMDTWLPRLKEHGMGSRTGCELLTHQAGLEPWIPFYVAALADSSGVFANEATDGCACTSASISARDSSKRTRRT